MSLHQIRCINKQDRLNPHERILHIGGLNDNNTRWKLSQTDAITAIQNGTYSFYVSVGSNTANVIIGQSQYGHLYLTTEADRATQNNLLSLPECP
jgi:hypothetical protein